MYEMKHDDDPEYIARAFIRALDAVDKIKITSSEARLMLREERGVIHERLEKITEDHGIKNYHRKLSELGLAAPRMGDKGCTEE